MRLAAVLLLSSAAALVLEGCSSGDPRYNDETIYIGGFKTNQRPPRANFDDVSYWDGDGVPGEARVRISLGEQRAYFFKGGQLVGVSVLSTGREGYGTPTGTFKIIQKDRDHKSNLYGDYVDRNGFVLQKDVEVGKDPKPPGAIFDGARMPYFMRIVGGVGMHEGFLPGYAASHGCIRMPGFMAEAFFNNVSVGTPVTITH
jgi:lipoprotein-anchoring transpeptidase ErfK/SrfK